MKLQRFTAVRFEDVLMEGRTQPLVLACRLDEDSAAEPKVVKAIGCPELSSTRPLVAEVIGNAVARRLGVPTPDPCLVYISDQVANFINASVGSLGLIHRIERGWAAGCELVRPSPTPYTIGQNITPIQRTQAARLYVSDMLCQNSDRRPDKVNCGFSKGDLIAFDFEMCFQHLFLHIIGGVTGAHWEPSRAIDGKRHLFYKIQKDGVLDEFEVASNVATLTPKWWNELYLSLPEDWKTEGHVIGTALLQIGAHSIDLAKDLARSII